MGIVRTKDATYLLSRIKSDLTLYDEMGLIENKRLYRYIKEVINEFGIAFYNEMEAVLPVENYKFRLPDNTHTVWGVIKMQGSPSQGVNGKPVTLNSLIYTDVECKEAGIMCGCELTKEHKDGKVYEVKIRRVADPNYSMSFHNPQVLDVKYSDPSIFDSCGLHAGYRSGNEVFLDANRGIGTTTFADGYVYLLYYGFPLDDVNLPQIPDYDALEKGIIAYSKFKLFQLWWENDEVPNISDRMQNAEKQWLDARSTLAHLSNLPTYRRMKEVAAKRTSKFDKFQFAS